MASCRNAPFSNSRIRTNDASAADEGFLPIQTSRKNAPAAAAARPASVIRMPPTWTIIAALAVHRNTSG